LVAWFPFDKSGRNELKIIFNHCSFARENIGFKERQALNPEKRNGSQQKQSKRCQNQ